jgi:hypothetical protein
MSDLTLRGDKVRAHNIQIVDLLARHELIDLDRLGRFDLDRLELLLSTWMYRPFEASYPLIMSPLSTSSPVSESTFL